VDSFLQIGLHELPKLGCELGKELSDDPFRKDLHVILAD
jgi:hypothetical protein